MPPFDHQIGLFQLVGYSLLNLRDRRGGLDGCGKQNFTAVTDSAQDSTGVIGLFGDLVFFYIKCIIILASGGGSNLNSISDLNGLDGTDGQVVS